MLKIDLEYVKGILFVRLNGSLNRFTSNKLNKYLVPVIQRHGIKYLVYNLYELKNIDEFGLKSLQNGNRAILSNSGEVYMCEIPKNLRKELKGLKLNSTNDELSAIELFAI